MPLTLPGPLITTSWLAEHLASRGSVATGPATPAVDA